VCPLVENLPGLSIVAVITPVLCIRHLTVTLTTVLSLVLFCRYDLSQVSLPEALTAEGRRIFRDRLVGEAAGVSFDEMLLTALRNHLGVRGECP
jgi:hypothetical protein